MSRLKEYQTVILRLFPELEDSRFSLLPPGGHSDAVDADGIWVFKFPRDEEAVQALQKEVRLLSFLGSRLTMPVPEISLHSGERLFSRHRKIPGTQLLEEVYAGLTETERDRVAGDLARFYQELHALDPEEVRSHGAGDISPWVLSEETESAAAFLAADLRVYAEGIVERMRKLPVDPLGTIYGFFDGHGWNMAFDTEAKRLEGIYDFADSGIGPLQRDFVYSNWISPDLTERLMACYEARSGLRLDRDRVRLLTAFQRLDEFAGALKRGEETSFCVKALRSWKDYEADF